MAIKILDKPTTKIWLALWHKYRTVNRTRYWRRQKISAGINYKTNWIIKPRKREKHLSDIRTKRNSTTFCEVCNKETLQSRNNNKKYCSRICRDKHFRKVYTNNGMWRYYKKSRRARETNNKHIFTNNQWLRLKQKTNGFCQRCMQHKGIEKMSLDHIIPLSIAENKVYTIKDIQCICMDCNRSKNALIEPLSYGRTALSGGETIQCL